MNRKEFNKRIQAVLRPEVLQEKRALVVGGGSGGGRVATELGRLGVSLILIDRPGETLQEHNIVRHELGYRALGQSKIKGLARHIHNLNPITRIDCVDLDVTAQPDKFRALLTRTRPHLVLACTDNQESKHVIDEIAVPSGIPVIGGAVYDGGVGGEVYLVRPGGPCYGCITEQLQLRTRPRKSEAPLDYNNLDGSEIRSTAALNLDIAQIAIIHARFALNLLLGGDPDLIGLRVEPNLIVFANRRVENIFERPFHAEFFQIKRRQDCLICGKRSADVEPAAEHIRLSLNNQG